MRRSHTSDQSEQSVRDAAGAGFDNITIDLMYGIPGQSLGEWESTLSRALSLPVQHLSAYHLTFETGTVFDHWRKQGKLFPVHEETSLVQYQLLREITRKEGFEHYEISNFAREGKQSEHNMLYWSGAAYMGVGPSAHSFDGTSRSWNISSLKKYMEAVRRREPFTEKENLSQEERYHDYLITSLRTRRGADPAYMERHFGETISRYFHRKSKPFLEGGSMYFSGEHISIHPDHWFITDHILRSLFVENPVNPGH
jgi:oxygen-independent coproporphyrinogen-3 oxidase